MSQNRENGRLIYQKASEDIPTESVTSEKNVAVMSQNRENGRLIYQRVSEDIPTESMTSEKILMPCHKIEKPSD